MTEAIYATGKRKTSIARVWLEPGEGKFIINERALKEYFGRETCEMVILQPFDLTGTRNQFDVMVNVQGGGIDLDEPGCIKMNRFLNDPQNITRTRLKMEFNLETARRQCL